MRHIPNWLLVLILALLVFNVVADYPKFMQSLRELGKDITRLVGDRHGSNDVE